MRISTPSRTLLTGILWGALAASTQLLMAAPAHAQAARYELDPEHTTVAFLVDHIGYAKVLGLFRSVRGNYRFDEATATLSELRIEVETASVFTNLRKRDDHLKGPDFLNSGEFPKMVFTASSAKRTGDRTFDIGGQLELLGKSQPITLQATWNKSAESPIGGVGRKPYVMGVSARGSFKRSTYGMNYAVANGWVGDEIPLIIEFEAIRQ
jgi:polyisoprenoid-binding protein YceI